MLFCYLADFSKTFSLSSEYLIDSSLGATAMTSPLLYWRTLRHLTVRQLAYQIWNRLRPRPRLRWANGLPTNVPGLAFPLTVTYLNQPVTFTNGIDWNHAENGKLWTYCLAYFEDLPQRPAQEGLALIYDFIRQTNTLHDALEPYPTSLRLLHWRAFLVRTNHHDPVILRHMRQQTALLRGRLEYHLGGNHLLENACALVTMGVFLENAAWLGTGNTLLRAQLAEQILTDGGHYERSPVYHQLLTARLLDLTQLLEATPPPAHPTLSAFVRAKTAAMLNWLVAVTFRNGSVPMVNDAAAGVAPTTATLLGRARALGFAPVATRLGQSGYRMLTTPRLELFADVGPVGPNHQPGHAHADTFSFVLHVDGQPLVVDPGTSTYQTGPRRQWERSTAAHNTVVVAGQNSSEVWGVFRVGRRAQVTLLTDTPTCLEATHNGYAHLGETHRRRWVLGQNNTLRIYDTFSNEKSIKQSYVYLCNCIDLNSERINSRVNINNILIEFDNTNPVQVRTYHRATGFNQTTPASYLLVPFATTLTTLISAPP